MFQMQSYIENGSSSYSKQVTANYVKASSYLDLDAYWDSFGDHLSELLPAITLHIVACYSSGYELEHWVEQ